MAGPGIFFDSVAEMVRTMWRHRTILRATTQVELRKKFAGSILGGAWIVLQPLLFLAIYLFVYLVIFRVRFPGLSQLGYVVYVFAGLVPYLALMEVTTAAAVAIKQNMHLVRNVIVPIDLIPVRTTLMVIAGQLIGLVVIVVLLLIDGSLSFHIAWLPLVMVLQFIFMLGLVYIISALGVLLPDLGHFINYVMIFLLFVSPIGFRPEMLPASAQPLVWLNPVHYMLDSFRSALIAGHGPNWSSVALFALLSAMSLLVGATFFRVFKGVIVDYE